MQRSSVQALDNNTNSSLLSPEQTKKPKTEWFWPKIVGVILIPVIGNFVWLMIPFRDFHENECGNSPHFWAEFIWSFFYLVVTVQATFALMIPLTTPRYKIQFAFNAILSCLFALAMTFGGRSSSAFLASNWFPVLIVMFGVFFAVFGFQIFWDRINGKSWERQRAMVFWCVLLICFVLMFFGWSELVMAAMTAKTSWLSPVFLPVAFVLGLSAIRRVAQFVAVGMSKAILFHQSAENAQYTPLGDALAHIDTDYPAIALDFMQQFFYFMFYRQLFFGAHDFVSMGILQLHGMAIDLVVAFACLRFSVVQFTPSHVTLQIERKYLCDKGYQLVCRQIARFASLISVMCFTPFLRYGYNKCFYSTTSSLTFGNILCNFVVMGTWEGVFVVVLFYVLRKYLGLDLIACAKHLFAKPYVVHLLLPLALHFISDVYFGLHTF